MNLRWLLVSLGPIVGGCLVDPRATESEDPLQVNDKTELFEAGFKEVLKASGLSTDLETSNALETLQPGSLYSNHHFSLSVDFPDNWRRDRGVGDYSIWRSYEPDSGMTFSLIVIPIQQGLEKSAPAPVSFQESPLGHVNHQFGGRYKEQMVERLTSEAGHAPLAYSLTESRIGAMHFLVTDYKYKQWAEDIEYVMQVREWMTQRWGHTYLLSYTAPELFFDSSVGEAVIYSARFLNPRLLNRGSGSSIPPATEVQAPPPTKAQSVIDFIPDSARFCQGGECTSVDLSDDFRFVYETGRRMRWLWPQGEYMNFAILSSARDPVLGVEHLTVRLSDHNMKKVNRDSPGRMVVRYDSTGGIIELQITGESGRTPGLFSVSTFY